MKQAITCILLICCLSTFSQKDKIEFFMKHSVGFYNPSNKPHQVIDNQFSIYINTFGNLVDCNDMSLGGCLLTNLVIFFSALEASIGFDTHLAKKTTAFEPKIGVYLRPLYYGKVGVEFGTLNPKFIGGFSIPFKKGKYQLEFLYKNIISYKTNGYNLVDTSRFQIGLMIKL